MKALCKLVLLISAVALGSTLLAADKAGKVTYKWVDQNGITQYTERPPKNRAYEKITVSAGGGREVEQVTAEQAAQQANETTQSALDQVVQANERNCKIAQQNMQVLKEMARIRVSDDKGENRVLTDEEKQARIAETQKQIDIYCKDIKSN